MNLSYIDFDTMIVSPDLYNMQKEKLKTEILSSFENRTKKLTFQLNNITKTVTYGKALAYLILLKPYTDLSISPNDNSVLEIETINANSISTVMNDIISRGFDTNRDEFDIKSSIADVINEMSDISGQINAVAGNSMSFLDFLKMSRDDKRANELFYQKIDHGMQYNEIEAKHSKMADDIMAYLSTKHDSAICPYIKAGAGINKRQLAQGLGFIGLKPDIDGTIIPVCIESNYLRGLQSIEEYYINAKGTRKALIINASMTGRGGYNTRKMNLSNIDRMHDDNISDCGTKLFIKYYVKNAARLEQIIGRHYYMLDENMDKISDVLYTVRKGNDSLIGKTIGLRSPVTCCSDKVCATCYGRELSKINRNLHTGLVATMTVNEPVQQTPLSAKHLLMTLFVVLNWGVEFLNTFTIHLNLITLDNEESVVKFKRENMTYDEELGLYYIDKFDVVTGAKKVHFSNLPSPLYIEAKMDLNDDDDEYEIVTLKQDADKPMFSFVGMNNEITKSMQAIIDLIEGSKHLGITDIHAFVDKFDDLMVENNLGFIRSVHMEMISSSLIESPTTNTRPDMSGDEIPPYIIAKVSKSVMNSSLAVSMAFERLPDQLTDMATYKKDTHSIMDRLYL